MFKSIPCWRSLNPSWTILIWNFEYTKFLKNQLHSLILVKKKYFCDEKQCRRENMQKQESKTINHINPGTIHENYFKRDLLVDFRYKTSTCTIRNIHIPNSKKVQIIFIISLASKQRNPNTADRMISMQRHFSLIMPVQEEHEENI